MTRQKQWEAEEARKGERKLVLGIIVFLALIVACEWVGNVLDYRTPPSATDRE